MIDRAGSNGGTVTHLLRDVLKYGDDGRQQIESRAL